MILVVGAGERRVKDAVHHDVQRLPGIDIVCEFWELAEYVKEDSCDEIHMTHVLEHFPMQETSAVLYQLKKLLKPEGRMYIEVPNFKWHAQEILLNPHNRQVVEYAFGGQHNQWDYHYNGFTPEILKEDLEHVGLKVIELYPNSSIECWSRRED